jgi:hypothetical protein
MKRKLLTATAALALFAGTSVALAQEPPRGAPAERIAPKAPAGVEKGGAEKNGAVGEKSAPARGGAAEERGERPGRAEAQPNRGRGETTGQAPQNERREQGNERRENQSNEEKKGDRNSAADKPGKNSPDQKAGEDRTKTERDRTTQERGNARENGGNARDNARSPATTGQGAAPSKGNAGATVNLSPEKRTRIHDVFTKERGAPRVDHVDFDLSVGVVVPRTVRIVAVPREIITIEPEWRGYEFFMVGSEIIIVDPRSMEIVYVFEA